MDITAGFNSLGKALVQVCVLNKSIKIHYLSEKKGICTIYLNQYDVLSVKCMSLQTRKIFGALIK